MNIIKNFKERRKRKNKEIDTIMKLLLENDYESIQVVGRGLVVKDYKKHKLSSKENKENEELRKMVNAGI